MVRKAKVLMLGAFGVGKTSLVSRYVNSIFSDRYQTTVGVKIEKKPVDVGNVSIDLILWDVHGQDDVQEISASYFRGAAGYLLVADGTRPQTLAVALALHDRTVSLAGPIPFALLLNKVDLESAWSLDEHMISDLIDRKWAVLRTSARSGAGVEDAFETLARAIANTPRTEEG